mgnify:CR=1 FL=1
MENTSDSFMPRPLLFCLKSGRSVCYSVPDNTTYKLKLNHGDLKATQGDTGHAEIDMITSIYAHILDEDRKVNAQKFETAFYAKPDLRNVRPPEEPAKSEPATLDLESLVEQLQKSPELASALAALIAAQAPAK